MLVLVALLNPLFNRGGETVLFTFYGGIPFTLEPILYGAASASMFISVICWFSCYNTVITSDKLQFLLSRFSPSLSLLFSMTLRFVPRMKMQLKAISSAQRCIGKDITDGTLIQRARHGMRILSALAAWALENAVETADSMKSRGYGLPGRSSFSVFRFDGRDLLAAVSIAAMSAFIALCLGSGSISITFFPVIKTAPAGPLFYAGAACYLLLCTTPLILEGMEALSWKLSTYRI
jgi:energy-coupling factor transport system permease protein